MQVVNLDPPGEGFNDATPATSVPNNSGDTVGSQKLAVVQWAANRLGQLLYSPVPIVIEVSHDDTLFCDANAATLAAAGPSWLLRRQSLVADHPDLPTWYPSALGQRLLGTTLFDQDVSAAVNPDLGAADCLSGFEWYYGLDGDAPNGTLPFVDTVLHELTHGVGFTALVGSDGVVSALDPTAVSPYFSYAYDTSEQKFWWQMSAQERAASATSGLLVWAGPRTTLAAGTLLSAGVDASDHPFMYAPAQFDDGSSLSHFDSSATPDLLMEPNASASLDVFTDDIDLGFEFLQDLGWRDPSCGNGILDDEEECDLGAGNDANADAPDECTTSCAWFVQDDCPLDPNKTSPGVCGCGKVDTDSDGDEIVDCLDACPQDPDKFGAGVCGCGNPDTDTDSDSSPDCVDACDLDANKTAAGECGCGVSDADDDGDDTPNCLDDCPGDPAKLEAGLCGCGTADTDTDHDATPDCEDDCADDPLKVAPGECGCGVNDDDDDSDGRVNCLDGCPDDAEKVARGVCGCGVAETDTDDDGTLDCKDDCPNDAVKIDRGECGCGTSDVDRDRDGTPDCLDACPIDASKLVGGLCGCGESDIDQDFDGTPNCNDACPVNASKTAPGACGCGEADTDTDHDGTADCMDDCPDSALKKNAGVCGCDVQDEDTDHDLVFDCQDACPSDALKVAAGECGCGVADVDQDEDGIMDCRDRCPDDTKKRDPGECGCGVSDRDNDNDSVPDCVDECPNDPDKVRFGDCGCGESERDSDRDTVKDCVDECPNKPGLAANGCATTGQPDFVDGGFADAGLEDLTDIRDTQHLIDLLRDGGTVSEAEIQAWLADGGDPRDLPPELVQGWVKGWAADGGATVKIAPSLPDACQCTTPGAGSRHSASQALVGLLVAGVAAARRRSPRSRASRPR